MIEPIDEHNRTLLANVHPPEWVNPTPPPGGYDMVVVGAGPAGLITAIGSVSLGKRVALIERRLMGGDCLNVGCVPSKALIASASVAAAVRDARSFGVNVPGEPSADFPAVMQRIRRLRASISPHDSAKRYAELGVDVYLAAARFTGPNTIDAGGVSLRFRRACIATGSRPAVPPILGLDTVDYLTNETLFELTEPPRRLGVIGAGAIGCEMAQAFARLGSEVVLVEASDRVLPGDDPDVGRVVRLSLERDGVTVLCPGRLLSLSRIAARIGMHVETHGVHHEHIIDRLLVATGRTANVEGLGLETAGVRHDERGVTVDHHLRTTNPRVYAAGDVCSRHRFTHAADAMARIVIRNALLGWVPFKPRASRLVIPRCTYTDPEVAHVGATAAELDAMNVRYEAVMIDLTRIDRAVLESQTDGFLKVHVTPGGRILGATLVSRHAGESIGELTAAMVHGVKLHELSKVIHPYPTRAEAIKRAADEFYKRRLLRLRKRMMFWT